MSGKHRGIFQMIWKSFVASVTPNFKLRKLVGTDFYGTKYYEESIPNTSQRRRPSRYFEPVNKDDFEQELPAEWEAWLRYRRKLPPAQEEVEQNYLLAMKKKENAEKLAETYSSKGTEKLNLPVEEKGQQSFPTYKEYGQEAINYKIKRTEK